MKILLVLFIPNATNFESKSSDKKNKKQNIALTKLEFVQFYNEKRGNKLWEWHTW